MNERAVYDRPKIAPANRVTDVRELVAKQSVKGSNPVGDKDNRSGDQLQ